MYELRREIAALFNTTVAAVNNAVKRIWERNVLRQGEYMRCVEFGAGRYVDKYILTVVIDLSFRLDTLPAHSNCATGSCGGARYYFKRPHIFFLFR